MTTNSTNRIVLGEKDNNKKITVIIDKNLIFEKQENQLHYEGIVTISIENTHSYSKTLSFEIKKSDLKALIRDTIYQGFEKISYTTFSNEKKTLRFTFELRKGITIEILEKKENEEASVEFNFSTFSFRAFCYEIDDALKLTERVMFPQ